MPVRARVPLLAIGAITLMVGGAFGDPMQDSSARGARVTPAPTTFDPTNVMAVPVPTILKFVSESLQFDTTLGAADEQLIDFERAQFGTATARLARIEPERGSYRLDTLELARGRIIARIKSDTAVPELGLGPWWTSWWVDRRGPNGSWRSVFIPEAPGTKRVEFPRNPLVLVRHPPGQWRQGIARFWVVKGELDHRDPIWIEAWGTCGGCCRQRLVVGGGY